MCGFKLWLGFCFLWIYGFSHITGDNHGKNDEIICPDTWHKVDTSCMRFETDLELFLTKDEARRTCRLLGSDLAILHDKKKFNDVKKILRNVIVKSPKLLVSWWVGLDFLGDTNVHGWHMDNDWFWVDGQNYNKTEIPKWAPEFGGSDPDFACGVLEYQFYVNNGNCSDLKPFICEQTTEPPATAPPTTEKPTDTPTGKPTDTPTDKPTDKPTGKPTDTPTGKPTDKPTGKPTDTPTGKPTDKPTGKPTDTPTGKPTDKPTGKSTDTPTGKPTDKPTGKPTDEPTGKPTDKQTGKPTDKSNGKPTDKPTGKPTDKPTGKPTDKPTGKPTDSPNGKPTDKHTGRPTDKPTGKPTDRPTVKPVDFTGCYAINHGEMCPPVEAFGISWQETAPGKLARVPCEHGEAKWKCDKKPTCWKGEPDIKQCTSEKIQDVTNQLEELEGQEEIDSDAAEEFTENLATAVDSGETLSEQDIFQSSKLMDAAKKAKPKDAAAAQSILKNVLKSGSSLVSKEKQKTWNGMTAQNKRAVASSILTSLDSVSIKMVQAFDKPAVATIKEDNMVLALHVLDPTASDDDFEYAGEENAFSIPPENLKVFSQGGLIRLVFIDYENMTELLDPGNPGDGRKTEVISKVTSAAIADKAEGQDLVKPIMFTFKVNKNQGPEGWKQQCSYWDFNRGYAGAWSNQGCSFWSTNDTHTTCKCDHMTNFAVLLNVHSTPLSEVHATTLSYITYVGIIISIVCLFLSWITFICLSAVQGERNSIHKHLVFCMFIAEVVFLAGIERTDDKIACSIIAGVLHYFFLGSFMWMLIEGVHILFMLVQVFDAAKSRMRYYYLFGYGCPLIAVGVSALVYYEGYGTDKYCWLSTERWFMWSFAGPVAVILLVNLIILIYAMAAVCKHSEYVFTKGKGSNFKGWIQGALALEVLLGLTWVFGYFYINEEAVAMAYLFTIFNSLQGLFIFVFHCLFNKKVRKEYEKFIDYKPTVTSGTNISSKCANGSAGSGPHHHNNTSRKQSDFLDLTRTGQNGRSGSTTSV